MNATDSQRVPPVDGIKWQIKRSIGSLSSVSDDLLKLDNRAEWQNPYFSIEWLCSWFARQPEGTNPILIFARRNDGPLEGFWPFVERPGILGSKGLWPFVYDEANYFHPVSTIAGAPVLLEGLCSLIGEFLFCWIPSMTHSFWSLIVHPVAYKKNFLSIPRSIRKTSLVHPSAGNSFDEYWSEKMGAKSRKSLRYDQRGLLEKGEVRVDWYDSFKEVRAIMPTTCIVEVESWKSLQGAGLYTIRGKRGFFFELFPELARAKRVRISILWVGEKPVAWEVDLLGKKALWLHHLAYDQRWKKFSPGKQLLQHTMRRAWEEGRMVDFLPVSLDYKEKIASLVEPAPEIHWFKKSFRGLLARRLILWNMKIRKKIRQNATPTKASEPLLKSYELEK